MYHLLVSAADDAWTGKHQVFGLGRYLNNTADHLRDQFGELDTATLDRIRSIPALFVYETPIGQPARVGQITDVKKRDGQIRVTFKIDETVPAIEHSLIQSLDWDLEIEGYELGTTHWAIKGADLFQVLRDAGATVPAAVPAPETTRAAVLDAAKRLETLGHTDLDRLLLEFGLTELENVAGRDQGSRATRVNAIAGYALANLGAVTAEGVPLTRAMIDRANALAPEPVDHIWDTLFPTRVPAPVLPPKETTVMPEPSPPSQPAQRSQSRTRVFVVHGRNDAAKHEVARYLERLDLEAVILHDEPNMGRSLVNKFQEVAAGIEFAVVVMTPDDIGHLQSEPEAQEARARQNVVFELGFFIGRLGAHKVCALVSGNVKQPSDFDSVVYIPFGSSTDWKVQLARELRAANVRFDPARVID